MREITCEVCGKPVTLLDKTVIVRSTRNPQYGAVIHEKCAPKHPNYPSPERKGKSLAEVAQDFARRGDREGWEELVTR